MAGIFPPMNGVGSKKLIGKWVALAVALVAGFACAAPAQAGWGPPIDISPPVSQGPIASGDARVAALPDGGFIYVWAKVNEDSSHDIVSRVVYPDGSLSPVNTLADGFEGASSFNDPFWTTVAAGNDGTIRATWTYQDMYCSPSCDYRTRSQTGLLDEDGRIVATATLDSTPPSSSDYMGPVSLSVATDGNALLAWRYWDQSETEMLLRTAVMAPGQETVTPVTAFSNSDDIINPDAAAATGGGGFVAFPFGDSLLQLRGLMVGPAGTASTPEILDEGPVQVTAPQTLIDSEGTGTVVYQGLENAADQIWMRKMDSDADPLGAGPVMVSNDDDGRPSDFEPQGAAIDSEGKVVTTFSQALPETGIHAQLSRTIASDGTLGPIQTVAQVAGASTMFGSVALSPDGGGSVLYSTDPSDGPTQINVRALDTDFAPTGTSTLLDERKDDSTIIPNGIAYSGNGDAAALWIDLLGDDWDLAGLRSSVLEVIPPDLDVWVQPKAVQNQEIVVGAEASDRSGVTVGWDFGDGGTAAGHYAKHTFTKAGTFDVKITATDGAGNKTVKTVKIEVLAAGGPIPPRPIPPDTQITGKPGKKVKAKAATFKFTSSLTGSNFECRLDKAGWTDCRSPKKLKKLKPGKHTFKVRAIKGDLIDPTPAGYDWTVKKPAKKAKKGGRK